LDLRRGQPTEPVGVVGVVRVVRVVRVGHGAEARLEDVVAGQAVVEDIAAASRIVPKVARADAVVADVLAADRVVLDLAAVDRAGRDGVGHAPEGDKDGDGRHHVPVRQRRAKLGQHDGTSRRRGGIRASLTPFEAHALS
jgi:hypothetical protein